MPGLRYGSRLLLVLTCGLSMSPQLFGGEVNELWPEIDFYKKFNQYTRLFLQVESTRDDGDVQQVKLGTYMDFYMKPMRALVDKDEEETDTSRTRPLLFRIGYNYIPSPNSATEQRIVAELSPRWPLFAGIVAIDRNGGDLRWISGKFSTRYRNRLTLERLFKLAKHPITPYFRIEETFDTRYGKWVNTAISAGSVVVLRKHYELETYLQHQNDSSKSPNKQINGIGLRLSLNY